MDHGDIIKQLADRAVKIKQVRKDVEKIYLFGSSSKNDHDFNDGADVLIVISVDGRKWEDRVSEFQNFFTDISAPVDVFPLTNDEIHRALENKDGFLGSMLKEKKEI